MTRLVVRLFLIHILGCIAVALGMYYPGVDLALSLLYMGIIIREVISSQIDLPRRRTLAVTIWQSPALILSFASIATIRGWGQANYAFFMLEFFYTPFLPLLSLLARISVANMPLYYYVLLGLPFLIILFYGLLLNLITKDLTKPIS